MRLKKKHYITSLAVLVVAFAFCAALNFAWFKSCESSPKPWDSNDEPSAICTALEYESSETETIAAKIVLNITPFLLSGGYLLVVALNTSKKRK